MAKLTAVVPAVTEAPVEVLIFTPTLAAILEAEPLLSKTVVPETVVNWLLGMLTPISHLLAPLKVQLEPSGFLTENKAVCGLPIEPPCVVCWLASVVVNVPRFSVLLPEPVEPASPMFKTQVVDEI